MGILSRPIPQINSIPYHCSERLKPNILKVHSGIEGDTDYITLICLKNNF